MGDAIGKIHFLISEPGILCYVAKEAFSMWLMWRSCDTEVIQMGPASNHKGPQCQGGRLKGGQ